MGGRGQAIRSAGIKFGYPTQQIGYAYHTVLIGIPQPQSGWNTERFFLSQFRRRFLARRVELARDEDGDQCKSAGHQERNLVPHKIEYKPGQDRNDDGSRIVMPIARDGATSRAGAILRKYTDAPIALSGKMIE